MATNKIDGKKYIGKTINKLSDRIIMHLNDAKNINKKYKSYFHNSIIEYGWDVFEVEIVFTDNRNDVLCKVEISEIKYWNTKAPFGYNLTDGGEGCSGRIVSKLTKEKLRKAHKGISLEERHGEEKAKEIKEKIKQKRKEQKFSEQDKNNMSEAQKKRHLENPTSEKEKEKISKRNIKRMAGKTYDEIYGEEKAKEIKEKMKKSQTGMKHTKERTEKKIGRKVSLETKEKMSKSQKKKHANNPEIRIQVAAKNKKRANIEPKIREAVDLHKQGLTRFEIAEKMNVTTATIGNYLKKENSNEKNSLGIADNLSLQL